MRASAQFRRGIEKAIMLTGISARQASTNAKCNKQQVERFMSGTTDIKLVTLDLICVDGFGLTFETVFRMGK